MSTACELTGHQLAALSDATRGMVGMLVGGPGTGKTTTIAHYMRTLDLQKFACAAPTGKAARRMTESLRAMGVDTVATTIHRLLEYGFDGFGRNGANPLEEDFVFIDESSMVSADLMARLMSARRRGSKFLFIGDPHQLPPVGHGAPLRDMLQMSIPRGRLTEIHRNAGAIVEFCKAIADGSQLPMPHEIELPEQNLVVDTRATSPGAQLASVLPWIGKVASLLSVDLVWDVQVITAMNNKSPVSREPLNRWLRDYLNPDGERADGNPFRVADKVTCLKNGWYRSSGFGDLKEVRDGKVYVANGEQGAVTEVHPGYSVVKLTDPLRYVKTIGETASEGKKWDLAYAISCHKSQGAEWPAVIVICDESYGAQWVCDRHWLMTAASRAQKLCVLIGQPYALQDYARRSHLNKRKTFAVELHYGLLVKN